MKTSSRWLAVITSGWLVAGAALAQEDGSSLVRARLTSDAGVVAPGRTALLAVVLEVTPGWHVYWKNPGDTGMPTTVTLELPPGLSAEEPRWPAPTRFVHEGLVSYGYEGRVTLLVPVRAATDVGLDQTLIVKGRVEWLVCDVNGCLMGGADVETALHVASGAAAPSPTPDGPAIAETLRGLPGPSPEDLRASWSKLAADLVLALEVPGADALTFFPHLPDDAPPMDMAARGRVAGARLETLYPTRVAGKAVTGLLAITRGGATTVHEVAVTAPR